MMKPGTFDQYVDSRAVQLGAEPAALRTLLTEAFEGSSRWRSRFASTELRQILESDGALATLARRAEANRIRWSLEDTAAVVACCPAMPDAARMSSDERLSKIHEPALLELAQHLPTTAGALLLGRTAIGKSMTVVEIISRTVLASRARQRAEQIASGAEEIRPRTPELVFVHAIALAQCVEFGKLRFADSQWSTGSAGLELWSSCDWLAIDDLGWDSRSGRDALKFIVNERYTRGLPTVATSGWSLAALEAEYGDALVRRIHERRGADGVVLELFDRPEAVTA